MPIAHDIIGAIGEAPLAPGVVGQPLHHVAVLVGGDADRAEMVGNDGITWATDHAPFATSPLLQDHLNRT
jgi:hypothetical protein